MPIGLNVTPYLQSPNAAEPQIRRYASDDISSGGPAAHGGLVGP